MFGRIQILCNIYKKFTHKNWDGYLSLAELISLLLKDNGYQMYSLTSFAPQFVCNFIYFSTTHHKRKMRKKKKKKDESFPFSGR